MVFRVNQAPILGARRSFKRHVGSRTDVRVWGALPLPDEVPAFSKVNETIVVYCPPVVWISHCWKSIPESPHRQPTYSHRLCTSAFVLLLCHCLSGLSLLSILPTPSVPFLAHRLSIPSQASSRTLGICPSGSLHFPPEGSSE
jgi:hypothetical protein